MEEYVVFKIYDKMYYCRKEYYFRIEPLMFGLTKLEGFKDLEDARIYLQKELFKGYAKVSIEDFNFRQDKIAKIRKGELKI